MRVRVCVPFDPAYLPPLRPPDKPLGHLFATQSLNHDLRGLVAARCWDGVLYDENP